LSPPPQRHRPVRLLCPTTTRPQVGERAVEVERQPRSRVSGRPARGSGWGALDAKHRPGEVIDTGIEDTDRIFCSHVVSEPLREQDRFVAVRAVDKTHASTQRPKSKKVFRDSEQCYSLPKHCVLTQSGAWFGAGSGRDVELPSQPYGASTPLPLGLTRAYLLCRENRPLPLSPMFSEDIAHSRLPSGLWPPRLSFPQGCRWKTLFMIFHAPSTLSRV